MEAMIWNLILTAALALIGFMAKSKLDQIAKEFAEIDRLSVLLNRTREELAREYVTRAEINTMVDKLGDRLDRGIERLEAKMEAIAKRP